MKGLALAVILFGVACPAGAQQVRLLEDQSSQDQKKVDPESGEVPQIITPSDDNPGTAAKAPAVNQAPSGPAGDLPSLESMSSPAAKPAEASAPAPAAAAQAAPRAKPEKRVLIKRPVSKPAKPYPVKPAAENKVPAEVHGAGFSVSKNHTVTGGDTLWGLSGKYYHDPYKWGKIYNANLNTVTNPDLIYPKEELVIPGINEEVKPEIRKSMEVAGGETVKEAGSSSPEVSRTGDAAAATPAAVQAAAPKAALPSADEELASFESSDLSEKMPEDQKEWTSSCKLAPDGWREDGVVTAKEKDGSGSEEDSLSMSGDIVEISLSGSAAVKAGDHLAVYLKGSDAYDKAGRKLGRELQLVGMLEVLSAEGSQAKARVAEATTPVIKGYVVKKK